MSLISLNIEQARQTASTFDRSSNELENLRTHLQQQWSTLSANWEGHSKHETEAEVHALLNRGGQAAQLTRDRGVKVTQIADRFQSADENEPFPVVIMTWAAIAPLVGTTGTAPSGPAAPSQLISYGMVNPDTDNTQDTDYEEAKGNAGEKQEGEGEEHYQWRIAWELEWIKWRRDRYSTAGGFYWVLEWLDHSIHYGDWTRMHPAPLFGK